MNENINLCEILEGCEGIELYSIIHGPIKVIKIDKDHIVFHPLSDTSLRIHIKSNGLWVSKFPGECIILPSKYQRDWSKFKKPIKVDTPIVCCDEKDYSNLEFKIRYYKCYKLGKHYVYNSGMKEYDVNCNPYSESTWDIMIPCNKFDPTNLEESLKYNIQK